MAKDTSVNVVIVGPSGSGKTEISHGLSNLPCDINNKPVQVSYVEYLPTIGVEFLSVNLSPKREDNLRLHLWDLGGFHRDQPDRKIYVRKAEMCTFCVNSCPTEKDVLWFQKFFNEVPKNAGLATCCLIVNQRPGRFPTAEEKVRLNKIKKQISTWMSVSPDSVPVIEVDPRNTEYLQTLRQYLNMKARDLLDIKERAVAEELEKSEPPKTKTMKETEPSYHFSVAQWVGWGAVVTGIPIAFILGFGISDFEPLSALLSPGVDLLGGLPVWAVASMALGLVTTVFAVVSFVQERRALKALLAEQDVESPEPSVGQVLSAGLANLVGVRLNVRFSTTQTTGQNVGHSGESKLNFDHKKPNRP